MLIAVSAILLVLGVLAYRRALFGQGQRTRDKGQSAAPGRRMEAADTGLLVLRIVVLLLFAAVFVGAVFTRVWTERPRQVAVVLDVSESMSAVGAESAAAAAAKTFPLPTGATRQAWVFGDTAITVQTPSHKPQAASRIAERTRIGEALKTVGKTRPGAVVLLSDGQDNGEVDAVAAARDVGVPIYAVGFGGMAKRNASVEQVMLPAVVYSGETVEVQVRVAAAGFADEKARVRLHRQTKEIVLGQAMAEQDVPFRLVFDKPGRQVIEARLDSLAGESNFADNTRSVTVDVRPGRLHVAYVTNRPGTGTRMMLRALASDERLQVDSVVAVSGAISDERGAMSASRADVFILDDIVENGSPEVWQSIAAAVQDGAGALVLAGPDFQPGASVAKLLGGAVGQAQSGTFTPELTPAGGVLPWFSRDSTDLAAVPPFTGLRPLVGSGHDPNLQVWLVAQENKLLLMTAEKSGRGKVVYVAGYPLWRWGFGPDEKPEHATPLSDFVTGVVRYLAERDTSPFWLQVDRPDLYQGQPVRLTLRAVAPDGRPWTQLSALVGVKSVDSGGISHLQVPMTETGAGVYEATIEALGPGQYQATATVSTTDTVLGKAATEFAIANQPLELANTGMNEGLLRAIAEASGGKFFSSDSLAREGSEISLGSYPRGFVCDPRRTAGVYVIIALLAGLEWFLRRRRGLL